MPGGRRKVPFSVKQKKEQLKQKRERRRLQYENFLSAETAVDDNESEVTCDERQPNMAGHMKTTMKLRKKNNDHPSSLYALQFEKETKESIEKQKELARKPITPVSEKASEFGSDEIFISTSELDFPKRPPWDYTMSKDELIYQETAYFHKYRSTLQKTFSDNISYYDMNLNNWQQLWRVLEMSDVILIIVDIRYPTLLFPPSLYKYIVNGMEKHAILVLNKVDMAPPALVLAWKHYFKERYSDLDIVCFTSFPLQAPFSMNSTQGLKRRQQTHKMSTEGSTQLLQVCRRIVQNSVDLTSWQQKLEQESDDFSGDEESSSKIVLEKIDTFYRKEEKFKDGILTIGCVGHPNVGKSSVINAIVGKKVVSVSKTPGHTKYFQTIFLTPTVKLCDCPGLVFPSVAPKSLQIIAGSYPIAQVREPYSTIQFLAERIPLPKLLRLREKDEEFEWSAWDICEVLAEKRGFKTAKAARNDTYRAANSILRLALSGQLCLCLRPPNFEETKEQWENHPEVEEMKQLQLGKKAALEVEEVNEDSEDWTEESESDVSDEDAEDADSETSENYDGLNSHSANKFSALSAD